MEVVKNINIVMVSRSLNSYCLPVFVIVITFLFSLNGFGQIVINEEPEIKEMMDAYKRSNFDTPVVRGWRIQIVTTNDRSTMEKAIRDFNKMYPGIKHNWEHNPPYYQLRIGAYEKRQDLEAFLLKLKDDFPAAIPVQDDIEKTKIIYNG